MSELKRILVPLDGSHLAEAALPMAVMLAQKLDCQILLVRVLDGVAGGSHRLVDPGIGRRGPLDHRQYRR